MIILIFTDYCKDRRKFALVSVLGQQLISNDDKKVLSISLGGPTIFLIDI